MAPVLVLKIKSESKLLAYPFINFSSLMQSVVISILFLFIPLLNPTNTTPWFVLMIIPIGFMLITQTILFPIMYNKYMNLLNDEYGK